MTRSTRILIATCLIIFFWLPLYAIFIAGLQWRVLPGAAWYVSVIFYALAGTLWIVPIGLAMPWMFRGAPSK